MTEIKKEQKQPLEKAWVDLSFDNQEEPWCSMCAGYTDYKRKWTSVARSDLDGGVYSENREIPHCVICGCVMQFLSIARVVTRICKVLSSLVAIISFMLCFYLFDLSAGTFSCWLICLLFAGLIWMLPYQSRMALRSQRNWRLQNLCKETEMLLKNSGEEKINRTGKTQL